MESLSLRRWNLFARNLEDLLQHHGLRLTQLDDRIGIHREKVRRLARSLLIPKSFPVLNTSEMQLLINSLKLENNEIQILRASIMATAVEEMLMDRIDSDNALAAAEQIYPLLLKAIKEYDGNQGLGAIKGGELFTMFDSEFDLLFGHALQNIDRGTVSLHLSIHYTLQRENKISHIYHALKYFEAALKELELANIDIRSTDTWKAWYDEATAGLSQANQELRAV